MTISIYSQGNEYISASRGAEITGYSSDYVGQLCRAGKVPSKLVGRTWYVASEALREYKRNQESGQTAKKNLMNQGREDAEFYEIEVPVLNKSSLTPLYKRDTGPLMPTISRRAGNKSLKTNSFVSKAFFSLIPLIVVVFIGLISTQDFAYKLKGEMGSWRSLPAAAFEAVKLINVENMPKISLFDFLYETYENIANK